MVPVKMVMSKKILKVRRGTKIKKVAELMRDKRVGSILVSDGNKSYAGIVTDADVVRRLVADGLDPETTPVEKVMTTPLLAIEADPLGRRRKRYHGSRAHPPSRRHREWKNHRCPFGERSAETRVWRVGICLKTIRNRSMRNWESK
ncbi:MAG: CBS domain-containing protein [Candidatus Manganitrophus sp.]|nr:CBS domain-containing protein [Candidatus Manganitrophus sp.]